MIVDLDIENFRCFRKVSLRDLRRFVVVVGGNGSGKSALLESIFMLLGNGPDMAMKIRAFRSLSVETSNFNSLWEDLFFGFDSSSTIDLRLRDSEGSTRNLAIFRAKDANLELPLTQMHTTDFLVPMNFAYTVDGNDSDIVQVRMTQEGLRSNLIKSIYPGAFVSQISRGFTVDDITRQFSALSQSGETSGILAAVRQLFPQVEDLRVEVYCGKPRVFVKSTGVRRLFPIDLLSAGVTSFLNLLVAIQTWKNGVILIDEFESGLHYSVLQRGFETVMEFARQRNVQVVLSTHSAEFLSTIAPLTATNSEDFCLLRTERVGGETRVKQFDGKSLDAALQEHVEIR